MNDIDRAVTMFEGGCACSQAILGAYGPRYGLDEDLAVRVSAGFAGGMKMSETCGAVTGAFMVLGLAHGGDSSRTPDGRNAAFDAVIAYTRAFRARRGAVSCRDLLGLDLSTPEGQQAAKDRGGVRGTCTGIVRDAAELLETLLPPPAK